MGTCAQEEKKYIRERDMKRRPQVLKKNLGEDGVDPEENSSPDKHGKYCGIDACDWYCR